MTTAAWLYAHRREAKYSEKEIATILEFESPEHMYQRLKKWGFPDWLVYEKSPETKKPSQSQRRARGTDSAEDLPPASAATELFRSTISFLSDTVERLPNIRWVSQGRHFVSTYVHRPSPDQDTGPKGPLGDWAFMRTQMGVTPAPPHPLVMLIAAYALAPRPIEPLVEALHPKTSEPDMEGINRLLHARKRKGGDNRDGLLRTAEQLATLVCGGTLPQGAPPPRLSDKEHYAACYITWRRDQNVFDEDIYEELRQRNLVRTRDDVSRLGKFRLRWPEE